MYGEHRWTIKDLIYHMVMEEAEKSYTASTKKRARDISKAIFDVPEVVNALRDASDHLRDHQILDMANIFEKELRAFTGEPGLGEFNAETHPQNLNIPELANRAKELAPGLWHFIQAIIGSSSADNHKSRKGLDGDIFMICMMVARLNAPRKNNAFHILLGIHLHSMGAKRAVIDLLAGLGITVSYQRIIAYSNDIAKIAAVSQRPYIKTRTD
jgi:hypothetical protein